ncbi:FixH family protein [Rhodobacteraceae bacterium 2376]|uniref:FixH family protein n=1 Tax=Rhabdonatronobacter sediminivivens TaxID=2743469 RepID=A0A7Z0KXI0_9RHOB|nr:FixH family protein [Rhabdonatronobacter sediminivivens]NYS24440.1 FixH family protein [Rhabdonatronobacter sediminivivens]
MTDRSAGRGKPLTGRKVLMIAVGAFAVILTANLTLAVRAVQSFPGLEVDNSFVASQNFNEELAAQLALGWDVRARVEDGLLTIAFADADGGAVDVASMQAVVGRATHVQDDFVPEFSYYSGTFTAPVDIRPGNWNIRLVAHAPDGTEFRQRVILHVTG